MTTNTIKANPFAIFTAAHAEARRLRENWPTVAYRDLFRAALKKAYEELRKLNAEIARRVRDAAKAGLKGFGMIFNHLDCESARSAKASAPLSVAEKLVALGGNRWTKGGRDRVYFNNATEIVGIETTYYKTGNLSSVKLNGEFISNSRGRSYLAALEGAYVDLADNSVHYRGTCSNGCQFIRDEFEAKIAAAIA